MLDILEDFLNKSAGPEMRDMVVEACDCFDKIELPHYDDSYVQLLMLSDTMDVNDVLPSILSNTLEIQKGILREQNIYLNEEAKIPTYTIIIGGLYDLFHYGDKQTLSRILNNGLDSNEILAELLALTTNKTVDELLVEIDDVSRSFIVALNEHVNAIPEPELPAENQIIDMHVKLIKRFCDMIGKTDLDTVKLLDTGITVGYPFMLYGNSIGRDLEAKSVQDAAYELVAMALISVDGCENPIGIIGAYIDHYIADVDKVTRITIAVSDLVVKLKDNSGVKENS